MKAAAVAVGFPGIYINYMFLSPAAQILHCSVAVSGHTLGGGQSILQGSSSSYLQLQGGGLLGAAPLDVGKVEDF